MSGRFGFIIILAKMEWAADRMGRKGGQDQGGWSWQPNCRGSNSACSVNRPFGLSTLLAKSLRDMSSRRPSYSLPSDLTDSAMIGYLYGLWWLSPYEAGMRSTIVLVEAS